MSGYDNIDMDEVGRKERCLECGSPFSPGQIIGCVGDGTFHMSCMAGPYEVVDKRMH